MIKLNKMNFSDELTLDWIHLKNLNWLRLNTSDAKLNDKYKVLKHKINTEIRARRKLDHAICK